MGLLGDMVVRIVGDTADFVRKIDQSGQKLKGFEKDIKKLTDTMSKVGKKMTMFVTLPILAAAAGAVKAAADFEKQRVAFETLLGSAEKAKPLLDEIERFAAATPFQLPDLLTGAKRLIGFGIASNQVVDTMRRLGNAAMGDEAILQRLVLAFGKVQAKGKASMEELNMFAEAGVPILEQLAINYGVTKGEMLKLVSLGKVGFSDVNKALTSLTTGSGKFAGMIEKQSQTLSGLTSTLKDNVVMLAKSFGDILLPSIKRIVAGFSSWVQRFQEMDVGQKKTIMTILALVAAIGPGLIVIAKLIKVAQALRIAFIAVNAVMMANPIVAIIAGIALLATGIVLLVSRLNSQRDAQYEVTIATDEERLAILRNNAAKVQMTLESTRAAKAKIEEALAITKDIEARKRLQKEIDRLTIKEAALIKAVALGDRYVANFKRTTDALAGSTDDLTGEEGDAIKTKVKAIETIGDYTAMQELENESMMIGAQELAEMRNQIFLREQEERRAAGAAKARSATALEIVRASTEGYNERHRVITGNIEKGRDAWGKAYTEEEEAERTHQDMMTQIRSSAAATLSGIITTISGYWDSYYTNLLANEDLTDEQKKKLQREQAKKSKDLALFNAVITGAEAILSGFSTKPFFPLGLAMGALATALSAVQIGVIAAQPLPKLARGGKLTRPTMFLGGEAGTEYVVPELALGELGGRIADAVRGATINNTITNDQPIVLSIKLDGRQLDAHVEESISNRKILVRRDSVA